MNTAHNDQRDHAASMKLKPVDSTNIAAIGHNPTTQTLRVKFKSGGVYDYPNVTVAQHQNFLAAESVGGHFHKHFKNRDFKKVDE